MLNYFGKLFIEKVSKGKFHGTVAQLTAALDGI
jgi:hypothetical protein